MQQLYVVLANLVVAAHIGYVSFVVVGLAAILLGGLCGWRWVRNPWFRGIHLLAITVVALETVIGMTCPLTDLENHLRILGGQVTLEGDFIGRVLRGVIFLPFEDTHWIFKVAYFGFAGLVLLTLVVVPPRWRKAAPAGRAVDDVDPHASGHAAGGCRPRATELKACNH